ncbi:ABC transporter substrate-binding protein [Streptomyces sp. NPDC057682]|uniref:ABC transporter substrate-binding protein n=1 Tax=Streptomyces sp. NPDC057682 TaxID=3346210 RepID=UPI003688514A
MNRKTLVLPAVVGLLAPLLAACGVPDGGGEDGGSIVVGTTDRFVAPREAPAPFDPAVADGSGARSVLRQTLQTLVRLPDDGGAPVPEAAEKCGFTDTGSESYRCTLRSGLTFADGGELTAEDVTYSIQRVLRIRTPHGPAALLDTLDTVEAVNDREVVFHLRASDATFPYKLATPTAGIVPRGSYPADAPREGFQVDGSGPYTMKPQVRDGRVTKIAFTPNPRYRGSLRIRNEGVELALYPDTTALGRAFDAGRVDLMTRTLSPQQAQRLRERTGGGSALTEMSGLTIGYLGFDTEDPAVRNTAVRRAMAQIVDRDRITGQVYGSTAEPLYSLIPSGVTGHTSAFFDVYGEPSADKAAAMFRKAKIPTPVRLTLHYPTDHDGPATAAEFRMLRQQLNDSGLFDVTVRGVPWATYRAARLRGDYAVYGMSRTPDFPDPDNFTAPFLGPDNVLGSPYRSEDAERRLIPQSRRESDRSAATTMFTRLQDIVARDVPVLPLWQAKQYVAARDGVTGAARSVDSGSALRLWEIGRE